MGRTILITGCSSGIGRVAADSLRARGWRVIASARNPEDVERLRIDGFDAVELDYSSEASVAAGWRDALKLSAGRIDAVFNNGGHGMAGALEDMPRAALEQVFHSNVFGVHQLTRLAAQHMLDLGGGRIVQHSSTLGFAILTWRGAYTASKHAVEGLAKTMRVELRGTDVHVSILNTGPVTSSFRANTARLFDRWIEVDASRHAAFYRDTFMPRGNRTDRDLFELPPEAVVRRLIHAIEAPRPRARYFITTPTWVAAAVTRLLPTRAQEWIAAKI